MFFLSGLYITGIQGVHIHYALIYKMDQNGIGNNLISGSLLEPRKKHIHFYRIVLCVPTSL
jgi:hypothetical protein